jgi:hypothetical protein
MSVEVPMYSSFVYGFDYHDQWYTQLKAKVTGSGGYALAVEQRYYYNMLKREEKEKKVDYKSADFISIKPIFSDGRYFGNMYEYSFACPVSWGLRRVIGKKGRLYFDASFGIGLAYFRNEPPSIVLKNSSWDLFPDLHFGIGIPLFNK